MRSIRCEAFGEPAGALTLVDYERPVSGASEVLCWWNDCRRVTAVTDNPAPKRDQKGGS